MESKRSKYILIGLSVFCMLLIGITSFKDGFLNPLRNGIGYFLSPIQSGVNRAGTSLYNGISNYASLAGAMEEKQAMQEQPVLHELFCQKCAARIRKDFPIYANICQTNPQLQPYFQQYSDL